MKVATALQKVASKKSAASGHYQKFLILPYSVWTKFLVSTFSAI